MVDPETGQDQKLTGASAGRRRVVPVLAGAGGSTHYLSLVLRCKSRYEQGHD
jgi:hypothetical protein